MFDSWFAVLLFESFPTDLYNGKDGDFCAATVPSQKFFTFWVMEISELLSKTLLTI